MASIYRRANSPFWWVQFKNPTTGKRTLKSTGFLHNDPTDTKRARALVAEMKVRELHAATHSSVERWERWVSPFLRRFCKVPRTYERYMGAWGWLDLYLQERRILMPSGFTYQDALGYLQWRVAYKKRRGRSVKLNTALNDMKVMRLVMRQAVRLGYATINPCDRLGVAREESKQKPELTDDDITAIRAALKAKAQWMQACFEIAIYTGCRLSETQIALGDVDLKRKTITFASPKGGRSRAFTRDLPEALEPLLKARKASGATYTLDSPPRLLGKEWWSFFKHDFKRPDLCFHCTRVTYVTRLARANVPLAIAKRLVNHSSTLVHAIYQRLGVDDVRQYSSLVAIPAA